MADFLAMGGYAVYVWPAYGLAALLLIGMGIASVVSLRRRQALLQRLQNRDKPEP